MNILDELDKLHSRIAFYDHSTAQNSVKRQITKIRAKVADLLWQLEENNRREGERRKAVEDDK